MQLTCRAPATVCVVLLIATSACAPAKRYPVGSPVAPTPTAATQADQSRGDDSGVVQSPGPNASGNAHVQGGTTPGLSAQQRQCLSKVVKPNDKEPFAKDGYHKEHSRVDALSLWPYRPVLELGDPKAVGLTPRYFNLKGDPTKELGYLWTVYSPHESDPDNLHEQLILDSGGLSSIVWFYPKPDDRDRRRDNWKALQVRGRTAYLKEMSPKFSGNPHEPWQIGSNRKLRTIQWERSFPNGNVVWDISVDPDCYTIQEEVDLIDSMVQTD